MTWVNSKHWTDQRQRMATEKEVAAFKRVKKPIRCAFCGTYIQVGDLYRWQFTNDMRIAPGNPMVCAKCDEGWHVTRVKWAFKCEVWKKIKNQWWAFIE